MAIKSGTGNVDALGNPVAGGEAPKPATTLFPPVAPPEVVVVDAQLPQVSPFILARLAEEATATAEKAMSLLGDHATARQRVEARALLKKIATTGLQVQRAARILGGDYLPSRENVQLDAAVRGAVEVESARAARHGSSITSDVHAATLWLEQSAEKAAKGWLIGRGWILVKTHDLERLANEVKLRGLDV